MLCVHCRHVTDKADITGDRQISQGIGVWGVVRMMNI